MGSFTTKHPCVFMLLEELSKTNKKDEGKNKSKGVGEGRLS